MEGYNKIESFLRKGQLEDALEYMNKYLDSIKHELKTPRYNEINNDLITLSAEFYNFSRQDRLGVVSFEVARTLRNRITSSVLALLDIMKIELDDFYRSNKNGKSSSDLEEVKRLILELSKSNNNYTSPISEKEIVFLDYQQALKDIESYLDNFKFLYQVGNFDFNSTEAASIIKQIFTKIEHRLSDKRNLVKVKKLISYRLNKPSFDHIVNCVRISNSDNYEVIVSDTADKVYSYFVIGDKNGGGKVIVFHNSFSSDSLDDLIFSFSSDNSKVLESFINNFNDNWNSESKTKGVFKNIDDIDAYFQIDVDSMRKISYIKDSLFQIPNRSLRMSLMKRGIDDLYRLVDGLRNGVAIDNSEDRRAKKTNIFLEYLNNMNVNDSVKLVIRDDLFSEHNALDSFVKMIEVKLLYGVKIHIAMYLSKENSKYSNILTSLNQLKSKYHNFNFKALDNYNELITEIYGVYSSIKSDEIFLLRKSLDSVEITMASNNKFSMNKDVVNSYLHRFQILISKGK